MYDVSGRPGRSSKWPRRLQKFFGSLPVRNYANDFVLWDMTAKDVWERFQLLEPPRCTAVSLTALRFILSSLAREKPRTLEGMLRYASIIDEMTAQDPPIVPVAAEWTALISFLGRSHKNPTSSDVDKCLQVWHNMENQFAVLANRTTFNVLLDIATKARRWRTTESLLSEMKSRAIAYDRFTWTTLIYGAGLRRDGHQVRKIARLMVEHGEVMDILAINSIMSALLRSGEAEEAESLFQRVMMLHTTTSKNNAESTNARHERNTDRSSASELTSRYQQRAYINRGFLRSGLNLSEEDVSPKFAATAAAYMIPDVATFNMLLQHHCKVSGDFDRVSELLEQMERFEIEDSISMFKSLLTGFSIHGNIDEAWSLSRLTYVFQTLVGKSSLRLTQDLARLSLRAFARVGTKADLDHSWSILDRAWQRQGGSSLKRSANVIREMEAATISVNRPVDRPKPGPQDWTRRAAAPSDTEAGNTPIQD